MQHWKLKIHDFALSLKESFREAFPRIFTALDQWEGNKTLIRLFVSETFWKYEQKCLNCRDKGRYRGMFDEMKNLSQIFGQIVELKWLKFWEVTLKSFHHLHYIEFLSTWLLFSVLKITKGLINFFMISQLRKFWHENNN